MIELDDSQHQALELMLSARVGVVTGGPGTGKSTVLGQALRQLSFTSTLCAAPTGKAAKRINEVLGDQAVALTIHRALGATRNSLGWSFTRNRNNPLEFRDIFVDESSMVSADLAARLVDAVGEQSRLIFVGDADQLPSVGPGQVFQDLIDSGRVPVARLTKVHRAAMESWVCRNAPLILHGDIDLEPCEDFSFVEAKDPVAAHSIMVSVAKAAKAAGEDFQILIPQGPGPMGTDIFNNVLQDALVPATGSDMALTGRTGHGNPYEIRLNDRIICTRNDYDNLVFNGEVGDVIALNPEYVQVDYGDRSVTYTHSDASALRLAHALTIHKAQGSEWEHVIVLCHGMHRHMWSRQLLYTALTRARKKVTLVGNYYGIGEALNNNNPRRRITSLAKRLR
jgi:exodeoxyribonuclease V alpha subunit